MYLLLFTLFNLKTIFVFQIINFYFSLLCTIVMIRFASKILNLNKSNNYYCIHIKFNSFLYINNTYSF